MLTDSTMRSGSGRRGEVSGESVGDESGLSVAEGEVEEEEEAEEEEEEEVEDDRRE